jgi:hypothetical protein
MYVCINIYTYIYIHPLISIYIKVYIYIHISIHVNTCIYIHISRAIRASLSPSALQYLDEQKLFFDQITDISGQLRAVKNTDLRGAYITDKISYISKGVISERLYMPTADKRRVVGIVPDSGLLMQSAAKCPFLLNFITSTWPGPDEYNPDTDLVIPRRITEKRRVDYEEPEPSALTPATTPLSPSIKKNGGIGKRSRLFTVPKTLRFNIDDKNNSHKKDDADAGDVNSLSVETTGPPALTKYDKNSQEYLKVEVPSNTSPLSLESDMGGDNKDEFYTPESSPQTSSPRSAYTGGSSSPRSPVRSPFRGSLLPRWKSGEGPDVPPAEESKINDKIIAKIEDRRFDACIFKVYDDCRQDALVIQIVRILKDEVASVGLPVYLVPYSVIPSRTGSDHALGGIIQVIIYWSFIYYYYYYYY